MAVITCKIPKELDEQLAAAAETRRVPKSTIVREALATALARNPQQGPSLYDLMKSGLGCVDSGVPDLATNKNHLAGYGRQRLRSSD